MSAFVSFPPFLSFFLSFLEDTAGGGVVGGGALFIDGGTLLDLLLGSDDCG